MNLIATELQEGVMKTRMQPIGNIWAQFPRTVRDVALGCHKEVNIEMEGKETELDKTIIEAIKDPLTHLVRNSVDHGIELPEDRVKAGKNRAGRLILRAFHEGGQVNIEISDDGAGLNGERIRKKAVERGVVTADQASRMTEREIFNLIFLPGFSTAEKVTNVSGRGVGMDVVKTNVEKIGGTVDVQSALGRGTTVRVKIPLGHYSRIGGDLWGRSLRHSSGELAGVGTAGGRGGQHRHRVGSWGSGLPLARSPATAGVSEPRAEAGGKWQPLRRIRRRRQYRGAAGRRTAVRLGRGPDQ
jgi:two-component sensor histidine kinase